MKRKPLPTFATEAEEAAFWATHSTEDYDVGETVTVTVSPSARHAARAAAELNAAEVPATGFNSGERKQADTCSACGGKGYTLQHVPPQPGHPGTVTAVVCTCPVGQAHDLRSLDLGAMVAEGIQTGGHLLDEDAAKRAAVVDDPPEQDFTGGERGKYADRYVALAPGVTVHSSMLDEDAAATCDRCKVKGYDPPGMGRMYGPAGQLSIAGPGPTSWLCFRCYREAFGRDAPGCEHDDPRLDGTDGAHPAYWRGEDHACAAITSQLIQIIAQPSKWIGDASLSKPLDRVPTSYHAVRCAIAGLVMSQGCLQADLMNLQAELAEAYGKAEASEKDMRAAEEVLKTLVKKLGEWQTKALDVEHHPAIVALREERDEARGKADASELMVASAQVMVDSAHATLERVLKPLRVACMVTQDESPEGCIQRLIEERDAALTERRAALAVRDHVNASLDALRADLDHLAEQGGPESSADYLRRAVKAEVLCEAARVDMASARKDLAEVTGRLEASRAQLATEQDLSNRLTAAIHDALNVLCGHNASGDQNALCAACALKVREAIEWAL
jgi:hypothetical protein